MKLVTKNNEPPPAIEYANIVAIELEQTLVKEDQENGLKKRELIKTSESKMKLRVRNS